MDIHVWRLCFNRRELQTAERSLLVRARKKSTSESFVTARRASLNSDAHEISETPGRDLLAGEPPLSAEQLEEIALCNVRAITYTNFKNSIT